MQTIEDFDKALNEGADIFIKAAKEWGSVVQDLIEKGQAADLPEHLMTACVNEVATRIETLSKA